MIRSLLSSTSPLSFAAAKDDGAAAAKTIDKVVYMSAEQSLENVVARVENAADATLRMIAAIVVHMVIRTYHHDENERRKYDAVKEEILSALKTYAETKRGQPFKHAWVARWISVSTTFARSLVTDYDKKGVQDGSPLSLILRAKTADKGTDIVFDFVMTKTKGVNTFAALEGALYKKPAKTAEKVKGSNATKPSTDKPERQAATLASDKGVDVINAMRGSAKKKAETIAEKAMSSNVDHMAFVLKALTFLSSEQLLEVSHACADLVKAKNAEVTQAPVRRKRTSTPDAEGGTPAASAASAS